MDVREVGAKIADLRKQHGLTQKELGDRLGVSHAAVSKWERGINYPDIELLEPLARVLGITAAELLGLEDAPSEEVIKEVTELSLEEREEIKRGLRVRLRLIGIAALILAVFELYFGWFLFRSGLEGVEYRVFTIGLLGAIGCILGNALNGLQETKHL